MIPWRCLYVLRDTLGPRIDKAMTPANIKKLDAGISAYIDRNSNILLSLDLSKRYSFSDSDRNVLFQFVGITEAEIKTELKKTNIYLGNKKHSNPFYILTILVAHTFLKRKDTKHAMVVLQYMSLMMYVSIHYGSFQYNPNKAVMDYTIAHLDQSFRIRHMSSLFEFLDDNTRVAFDTYQDRIERATDSDITWVIDAVHNRIKGKIIKIANAYYRNHEKGNYLNNDEDNFDETDYHEADNTSFVVDRIANKVYTKLINRQFDSRFIKYAITRSDTPYTKLKRIIDDVIDSDQDMVLREVIISIIEYFLLQSGKSIDYIGRGDFIVYMKTAYATNTDMRQMVFVKSTIDKWLDENMVRYGVTRFGKTVRMEYRKSIFMFIVFVINNEAKIQ